jgi:hypothetical protein
MQQVTPHSKEFFSKGDSLLAGKEKRPLIFSPEIKKYHNTRLFEFRGKDARGYDFSVRLCPLQKPLLRREPPHIAENDQIEVYFGGDPDNLKDIGTEIEIRLGKEQEAYKIDSTSIVYIPGGLEHTDIEFEEASGLFWLLNITLPPKYVEPG